MRNLQRTNDFFNAFWKATKSWDQRRQFIAQSIRTNVIERHRPRNDNQEGRRQFSYKYYLDIDGISNVVCKTMFLRTIGISEKVVRGALTKKNHSIVLEPEQQHESKKKLSAEIKKLVMDHINTFTVVESHYTRARSDKKYLHPSLNIETMYNLYVNWCDENNTPKRNIVKSSMYRYIFCNEFNLSFKEPKLDTCDTCHNIACRLKCEKDEDTVQKNNKGKRTSFKPSGFTLQIKKN